MHLKEAKCIILTETRRNSENQNPNRTDRNWERKVEFGNEKGTVQMSAGTMTMMEREQNQVYPTVRAT